LDQQASFELLMLQAFMEAFGKVLDDSGVSIFAGIEYTVIAIAYHELKIRAIDSLSTQLVIPLVSICLYESNQRTRQQAERQASFRDETNGRQTYRLLSIIAIASYCEHCLIHTLIFIANPL